MSLLGNIISPYEVIDRFPSDILRYYICETTAGKNINFSCIKNAIFDKKAPQLI